MSTKLISWVFVSPAAFAIYIAHLANTWANYMMISWYCSNNTSQLIVILPSERSAHQAAHRLPTYFTDQLDAQPGAAAGPRWLTEWGLAEHLGWYLTIPPVACVVGALCAWCLQLLQHQLSSVQLVRRPLDLSNTVRDTVREASVHSSWLHR